MVEIIRTVKHGETIYSQSVVETFLTRAKAEKGMAALLFDAINIGYTAKRTETWGFEYSLSRDDSTILYSFKDCD
jgi:hypothetical protein